MFCAHAIDNVTDQISATFDESSSSLSVWRVLPTFCLLLGNEGTWGEFSQAHY